MEPFIRPCSSTPRLYVVTDGCLLREAMNPPDGGVDTEFEREGLVDGEKGKILCRICGNTVTSEEERIRMNGSHEHAFMNPMGLLFHVGCFSGVRGCLSAGETTGEYTWFPGYTWSFAVCSACRGHLGWRYRSGSRIFWGLILDRLARG